jgi:hypothetical protein
MSERPNSSPKLSQYSPISIGPKSISSISISKSSDSFGTKNMKDMAKIFALGLGKKLDNDTTGKIFDYLKTNEYQLINELLEIYPFEHTIYTKYAEYLALNPEIHSLIPKLIEKITKDNPKKLENFYINLAKNTNKKVIDYLEQIYDNDPDSDILEWDALCSNPKAIKILEKEYKKVPNKLKNWFSLCKNPKAIKIVDNEHEKDQNKFGFLYWTFICENPKAFEIVKKEYDRDHDSEKINWEALCNNPNAIKILEEEYDRDPNNLEWEALCNNPKAINLIIREYNKDPNKLVWDALCNNPKAINLIIKEYNKDHRTTKINWEVLCNNPKAIKILEKEYKKDPNKLVWSALCKNPGAIKILEKEYENNPNKLVWSALCKNPGAIGILEEEYKNYPNSKNIKWYILSGNTNPNAIKLIIKLLEDMDSRRDSTWSRLLNWNIISSNPHAINIIIRKLKLEKSKKKFPNRSSYSRRSSTSKRIYISDIKWKVLLQNPAIFTTL